MSFSKIVNSVSQNFFGEACTYVVSPSASISLKAIFDTQWIEVNGVSTQALVCEIQLSDLGVITPSKGHKITRGAKTYKIEVAQTNGDATICSLILKDN